MTDRFYWEIFVFGSYFLVLFFLACYCCFSLKVRKEALQSLQEEGFLEEKGTTDAVK